MIGLIMPIDAKIETYPAVATKKTFARLTSAWELGHRYKEIEISARDPEEVLRQLPEDVICFQFYDRIVADVEADGRTVTTASDWLNLSEERYFVDVDKIVTRRQTLGWWKGGWYRTMREEMDEYETEYVVTWDKPHYTYMNYHPDFDDLVYRKPRS